MRWGRAAIRMFHEKLWLGGRLFQSRKYASYVTLIKKFSDIRVMFKKIVEHSNFHKSALKFEHSTVNHFIHYHFIERKDSENFQNFLRFNK